MVFCARNCIEECRLRLFKVKTSLEKCFTPLCVFGFNGKYGQTEIALHFDCKKTPRFYALILPSMYFRITHPERERERERDRVTPTVAKPSSGQAQIVLPPPPRSRQPSFLFFLSYSSTLLLPLAQRRWSSRHQPPAHFTPPPNSPDLAVAVFHPI